MLQPKMFRLWWTHSHTHWFTHWMIRELKYLFSYYYWLINVLTYSQTDTLIYSLTKLITDFKKQKTTTIFISKEISYIVVLWILPNNYSPISYFCIFRHAELFTNEMHGISARSWYPSLIVSSVGGIPHILSQIANCLCKTQIGLICCADRGDS